MRTEDGNDEFFEHAPIGMARVSAAGCLLAVNRTFCSMLGYPAEELRGRELLEFALPDEPDEPDERDGSAQPPVQKTVLCKQGGRLTVRLSAAACRGTYLGETYHLAQIVDPPERSRQREMLEFSAAVLRKIASGASLSEVLSTLVASLEASTPNWRVAIAVRRESDERLQFIHAPSMPVELRRALDGRVVGTAGGSTAAAIHTGVRVVVSDVAVHPAWRDLCEVAASEGVRAVWSEPVRVQGKPALGAVSVYLAEPAMPTAIDTSVLENAANLVGVALDHDERDARVRKSEDQLRTSLHAIGDSVLTIDAAGKLIGLNPAATRLTGWSEEEALGRDLGCVLQLDEVDDAFLADRSAPPAGEPWSWTGRIEARNGDLRDIALQGWPIEVAECGAGSEVLVLRDIGEERRREEQLRQTHKLQAVGQLAAGIAHDFNNLLTGILGNAELLAATERPNDRRLARDIVSASRRAAELTAQLLAFSRAGTVDDSVVDVHAVLREIVVLLERSVDARIRIHHDCRAERAEVRGDRSQLRNAILHLAFNARDAMPEGGELHFETELTTTDSGLEELEVTVRDTGAGMAEDVLERIFEPFFTTRPVGEGSGLGLAGVYGSVQGHGGRIRAESALGRGSVFRVSLPLYRAAETEEWLLTYGAGHVLVIDDEELVRNYAEAALGRLGYSVTVASDGPEALELLKERRIDPDLVVLDMVLPEMGGAEVFHCIQDLCPDLPVLLASGNSDDEVVRELLREGAAGFLSKPFSVEELGMTVSLALRRKS